MNELNLSERKVGRLARFLAFFYGVSGCVFLCSFLFAFNIFEYAVIYTLCMVVLFLTSVYCLGIGIFGRMVWFLKQK